MKKSVLLILAVALSFVCSAQKTVVTSPRDFSEIEVGKDSIQDEKYIIDTVQFIDPNLKDYINMHEQFKQKLIKQGDKLENSLAWTKIIEIDDKQLKLIIKELAPRKIVKILVKDE